MTTSVSFFVTGILNGTLNAIRSVVPTCVSTGTPKLVTTPIVQPEMGVLIGITGQVRGRLFVEAKHTVFASIAEAMFGMQLEGDMLESFVGELGNMIAGNMSTLVSQESINIDITPPTVLVGQTKLSGYETAIVIPVQLESNDELRVLLMVGEISAH